MKFIPARDLRIRPGEVWKKLAQDDLVITNRGQPVAVMMRTSGDTLENELEVLQRAKALTALDRAHRDAVRSGSR